MTIPTPWVACLAIGCAGSAARAEFVTPNVYGWSRGSANSTYFAWDIFQSPSGPNPPDVGQWPVALPPSWTQPSVAESSGASFITGGGNIYSFSTPLDVEVNVPNYGRGSDWTTTILVQVRTQGNELDYERMRVGSRRWVERVELDRQVLGGFGGYLVDTLLRFEAPGNDTDYLLEFEAAASSMSLDRLTIDTRAGRIARPWAYAADLPAACTDCGRPGGMVPSPAHPDGPVPSPGAAGLIPLALGIAGYPRRRGG